MAEIRSSVDFRRNHRDRDGDAWWSGKYLSISFILCLFDLKRRQHPELMLDGDRGRKNEFASEPVVAHLETPSSIE
jgi:hypothetical protein